MQPATSAWTDSIDEIIGGDLIALLGIPTDAGGVIAMPVGVAGLRDRNAGTVTFTTSLGFYKKLLRIERHPEVGLLFIDRAHGLAKDPTAVLVQGQADFERQPDPDFLADLLAEQVLRYFDPAPTGPIWDRLCHAYNDVRVRVTINVRNIITARPLSGPDPAEAPNDRALAKALRRAQHLRSTALGYLGHDGYPILAPAIVTGATSTSLTLATSHSVPSGRRRAALHSHSYGPKMDGMSAEWHSGWVERRADTPLFEPTTSHGFTAPLGIRFRTMVGSLQATVGLRRARKLGLVDGDRWIGKNSP